MKDASNVSQAHEIDLSRALSLHQAGQFADAARLYTELLAREPDHPDVLHLFGVLHHQNGYHARAIELIGRALTFRPEAAAFHANLAEAHRALRNYDKAAQCCENALRLQPDYPDASNNLGLTLHSLGRFEEAIARYRAALESRPLYAGTWNNLGTSLRELGQREEAREAFERAVALEPGLAMAYSNLGQLLIEQGRFEEGLSHCQTALQIQPDSLAALNNLGNAYRALERWREAHDTYDRGISLAISFPEGSSREELARLLENRGLAFSLEGKTVDALECFRRAVDLEPENPEIWRSLAEAHAAEDDTASALACRRRVVELKPESAQARNELGSALQDEGRLDEAEACFQRALELSPGSPSPLLNLGGLVEELGDLGEAEAHYRKVRADHPSAPAPLSRLALLLRGKLPDVDLEAIRNLLGNPLLAEPNRGLLLFGLAHVLDGRGQYADAAMALVEANRLVHQHQRKLGKHYDPDRHSRHVDDLIANFTPELFQRLGNTGNPTRQPVFVFGLPRSGTTLVEQILSSHSFVHGGGELRLAKQVSESIPALVGKEDRIKVCIEALDGEGVQHLAAQYLEGLQHIIHPEGQGGTSPRPGEGPARVVDKLPDNYLYLGVIALMFPNATLINLKRDLRDVAVSCWMTNFRSIRWTSHPDHLARRFQDYERLMAHWRTLLSDRIVEVEYEQLVTEFEPEARRLIRACGLDWEPACLDFHQSNRPVRTASVTQVRQPIYRRSVARWTHYQPALGDLFGRLPLKSSSTTGHS